MKKTSITEIHESLGAKMVEFSGYNMPLSYTTIIEEHKAVRNNIGIFDVSHMGEFTVKGENAEEFLQKITSNNVIKMVDGQAQYTCMPNHEGGIVDDLIIYKYSKNHFLAIPNCSNIHKDWAWWTKNNTMGAEIENISDEISQFAIQGPNALKLLQELTDVNLSEIQYYNFKVGKFADVDDVILSATGYTGEAGLELYCSNKSAKQIWNAIFKVGEKYNLLPIGLAARDTLRLEKGFCLYGNDINDTTSPIEAKLGWITKFVDGNNFINREYLENQKKNGVSKVLTAFVLVDKGIPRQHYKVCDENSKEIGEVTSGTISPMLNKGIGMAYINIENSKIDSNIYIQVRKKLLKAKIIKLPFWK